MVEENVTGSLLLEDRKLPRARAQARWALCGALRVGEVESLPRGTLQ